MCNAVGYPQYKGRNLAPYIFHDFWVLFAVSTPVRVQHHNCLLNILRAFTHVPKVASHQFDLTLTFWKYVMFRLKSGVQLTYKELMQEALDFTNRYRINRGY